MSVGITVVFVVAYFAVTIFLCRKLRLDTRSLCLSAISVALTLVLESIRIPLPTGATMPCLSIIPLMLVSLICGLPVGCLAGWVCGVLAMFLIPGWQPVHWAQIFVEQLVCFSCLGYVAAFGTDRRWKVLCGIVLASVLKFCGHLLSGVIFFSQNAWDGWGAWGYSLGYNLSQNLPLCVLCGLFVLALPQRTYIHLTQRRGVS